jgi:uroporphyrinogen-III synthase
VRGLWRALRAAGLDARAFAGARLAAVGPSTARALADLGLEPDLLAAPHRAGALVEALAPRVGGEPVLFPCGTRARREVAEGLRAAGAKLRELVVYATLPERLDPQVRERLRGGVDAVLFHSPSAVRAWIGERLAPVRTVVACLGATTAEAALRAGLEPGVIAPEHDDASLVEALERHFHSTAQAGGASPADGVWKTPTEPGGPWNRNGDSERGAANRAHLEAVATLT